MLRLERKKVSYSPYAASCTRTPCFSRYTLFSDTDLEMLSAIHDVLKSTYTALDPYAFRAPEEPSLQWTKPRNPPTMFCRG